MKDDINVHVQAAHYLNPDAIGNPSPIKVTLYELKNNTVFKQANFFKLQDSPLDALSGTLIDQRSFMIRPNEQLHFKYSFSSETRYVGIVVGYRQQSFSEWKKIIQINNNHVKHMNIILDSSSFIVSTS
jgi:type VI secretion system protein VasD